MNTALGGLFSSRINMNLREEHGYTYGAGSQFVFRRGAGPFQVASGVRTDVTGAGGVGDPQGDSRHRRRADAADELQRAKDALTQSLAGDFETSAGAAGSFSTLYVYDLPLDYYTR